MPDFVDALDARLRSDAVPRRRASHDGPSPSAQRIRNIVLSGGILIGCVVSVLAVLPTSADRAYGKPPALLSATSLVVGANTRVRDAAASAPTTEQLDRAWSVPAFGGTAYLLHGDATWCLSAPDPASDHPNVERGYSCSDSAEFGRIGISLTIGSNYIAVVREGVRAPTLQTPDGEMREIRPSHLGVVILPNLADGSIVTLRGPAGHDRSETIRAIPEGGSRGRCANGLAYTAPAGQPDPCQAVGGGRTH